MQEKRWKLTALSLASSVHTLINNIAHCSRNQAGHPLFQMKLTSSNEKLKTCSRLKYLATRNKWAHNLGCASTNVGAKRATRQWLGGDTTMKSGTTMATKREDWRFLGFSLAPRATFPTLLSHRAWRVQPQRSLYALYVWHSQWELLSKLAFLVLFAWVLFPKAGAS
jgi:hypothetical protein